MELSEVPSPLGPRLRGSVWEAGLSGSRETLDVVWRTVLLGVTLPEVLSPFGPGLVGMGHAGGLGVAILLSVEVADASPPFSPGLVGLRHASGLWVAVLVSVEVTEVLNPFGPGFKGKRMAIRYMPTRRSEITGNALWPWTGGREGEEEEEGAGLSVAVIVIDCVLRNVIDNNGTKPRGRE